MSTTPSVSTDDLTLLVQRGVDHPLVQARLTFADRNQILTHYLNPIGAAPRIYPKMVTPQASGRMGISEPPIGNLTADRRYGPHGIRDIVQPDEGMVWLVWDWDAIEARFISCYSGDDTDLEAFRRRYDIHTVTAIKMYRWPEPDFEPTKANIFKSDAGLAWCERLGEVIGGRQPDGSIIPYTDDHRFRRLAKNCRYALQYARDEGAMTRYAIEMRMPAEELKQHGRAYLNSKPRLVAWKRKTWGECWRTREARTFMGRRRRLFGARENIEKEGLNHIIQGSVADLMKVTVTKVRNLLGDQGRLVMQTHDGVKMQVPANLKGDAALLSSVKALVEQTLTVEGQAMTMTADFGWIEA